MSRKSLSAALVAASFLCALPLSAAGLKQADRVPAEGARNWSKSFDVSAKKPGTYNVVVTGRDAAGNETIAGPFNVVVDPKSDLPIATVANPLPGMRVGGDLNVVGTCVDDDATARVELSVDGGPWFAAEGGEFWSYYAAGGTIPDGRRCIAVRGVDVNGLVGPERSVDFDMDRRKPTVAVESHGPGSLVSRTVVLRGTAADANGVAAVEYSLDGGATFLKAGGSPNKKTNSWAFSAPVDTAKLPDGPIAVLLRAVDGVGSVAAVPFLMVVDNTPPRIELLYPGTADSVDGSFALMGAVRDEVGVASLSWQIGTTSGQVPVVAGDPYWVVPVSLPDAKGKEAQLSLVAVDTIGNRTEKRFKIALDLDGDKPVCSFVAPAAGARSEGFLDFAVFARDDDGVAAVEYWVDKGSPVLAETSGAFSGRVEGLLPGKRVLYVRAVDVAGTRGPAAALDFEDMGPPPRLRFDALVPAAGVKADFSIPFAPGVEAAPDSGAAVRIAVEGRVDSVSWTAGGASGSQSLKGASGASFLVPVPARGPYGIVEIAAEAADAYGRKARAASFVYVTDYSAVRGEPEVLVDDGRLGPDGVFRFAGADLTARLVGGRAVSVRLDPPDPRFQASLEGNLVRVRAAAEGSGEACSIVVTTDRGHELRSRALRPVNDLRGPSLDVNVPPSPYAVSSVDVDGRVADPSGVVSCRAVAITAAGREAAAVDLPFDADGRFAKSLDLGGAADGALRVEVRAVDGAGNESVSSFAVLKDGKAPSASFAIPAGSPRGTLAAFMARDEGGLASAEYAPDGAAYRSLPPDGTWAFDAADAVPGRASLRLRDRAGNEAVVLLPASAPFDGAPPAPADPAKAAPAVSLLAPAADDVLDGPAVFAFRIDSPRPLASVSWTFGTAKGAVDPSALVPLDPSSSAATGGSFAAAVAVSEYQAKAGPVAATVSVKDASGKTVSATFRAAFDPVPALPVVSVAVPEEGAAVALPASWFASASASAGVASLQVSVDGGEAVAHEGVFAASALPDGLAAGPHALTVVAVDAYGRRSAPLKRSFRVLGPAPAPSSPVLRGKAGATPFEAGGAYVLGADAAIAGTLVSANGLPAVEARFSDSGSASRPPVKAAVKKEADGGYSYSVPVPADLGFDRVSYELSFKDPAGLSSTRSGFFFRVAEPAAGSSMEDGLRTSDPRASAATGGGRAVAFSDDEPLVLRMVGRPLVSVRLDPPTELVSAELSGDGRFVRIAPRSDGIGSPVAVFVRDADGDEFSWGPVSFSVSRADPALSVRFPAPGSWHRGAVPLDLSASSAAGPVSVEASLDGVSWKSLVLDPVEDRAARIGLFEAPAEDGPVLLRLRATDPAGRSTTSAVPFVKDSAPPSARAVLPPAGESVNGRVTAAAVFADALSLGAIEFSDDDGATWSAADPVPPASSSGAAPAAAQVRIRSGARTADYGLPGAPASLRFRARDAAGNVAEIAATPVVDPEADKPRVAVQLPEEGEVLRRDFEVSGTAFDDDGIAAVFFSLDGAEPVRLPASGASFAIPFALATVGDNEHVVELYAEDVYGVRGDPVSRRFRVSTEEPKATFSSPSLDTTVRGVVDVKGTASDANGVAGLLLSFNNAVGFNAAEGSEAWSYRLDTRDLKDGLHSLYLRPSDAYGTEAFYASLVSVDNTPPVVELDLPADGAVTSTKLVLSGRASDSRELESCRAFVFRRGAAEAAAVEKEFALGLDPVVAATLDLSGLADGEYGVRLVARDRAGNESMASRDFVLRAAWRDEGIRIACPVRGERLSGLLRIQGRLRSPALPSSVAVFMDGRDVASGKPDKAGWFSVDLDPALVGKGRRVLEARFIADDGRVVASEPVAVDFDPEGPWVASDAFAPGAFVPGRPWLGGTAGWTAGASYAVPEGLSGKELAAARKAADEARRGREVARVEVSFDNGRTFQPAAGTSKWKFRLETQDYPEGPLPLVLRALYRDGSSSSSRLLLNLDKTPPEVAILAPAEGTRVNSALNVFGTASDDVELSSVELALRDGDKAGYKLPSFIEGLYLDGSWLGGTLYNAGAGLTFFDDNVKLQAMYGFTPENYDDKPQRFYGDVFSAKLLANVFAFPFSYAFGPDWNFLSANVAVGANFSYFTQTASGKALFLSAVVAQLEFPKLTLEAWPAFSSYSLYTEFQAWFISAEIGGGIEPRMSFGLRTSVF